ncbi:hypothetical protein NQ314_001083 [Rhamnusium bicolor]|uniref:Uncharacterized protein n=1 Tax=Rhamnusium bicolor TaxID=1586634 RepID=A0AAV8ZT89_9CUCU|nr:hypothetical protein NQ314_001083 [Rhamnusium bicolor]
MEIVGNGKLKRAPPYLGMNLSVRGRRIFRNRSRVKNDKEKEKMDKMSARLRRPEFTKHELVGTAAITKLLPKIVIPKTYKGPVIEDLIEELHKTVNDKDSGVDFLPTAKNLEKNVKKSEGIAAERVPKSSSSKYKINKNNSFCRKQNAKENIKKQRSKVINNHSYIGAFNDWSLKNKISSEFGKRPCEDLWEKETASILRGTNILHTCSININEIDHNKMYFRPHCLTTFDLNKLHLNNNNFDESNDIDN